MSEGVIQPDGKSVIFHAPEMEGISCKVQHSVASGKPQCPEPGMLGVGVVVLPTGQPRVVLQIKHADGTSLSASMLQSGLVTVMECLVDAFATAQALADKTATAVRQ